MSLGDAHQYLVEVVSHNQPGAVVVVACVCAPQRALARSLLARNQVQASGAVAKTGARSGEPPSPPPPPRRMEGRLTGWSESGSSLELATASSVQAAAGRARMLRATSSGA